MDIPIVSNIIEAVSSFFSGISAKPIELPIFIALLVDLVLLFCSGFMSSCEVAYFSLSPSDLSNIKEQKHNADAKLLSLLGNSDKLLATILIGNNLVNVAIVMLSNYVIVNLFDFREPWMSFLIQTIVLTAILLLFGEIFPKVFAQRRALAHSRNTATVMKVVSRLLTPFSKLLMASTIRISPTNAKRRDISVDELSRAVKLTTHGGAPEEKEMIEDIIKFYSKTAAEIMIPRIDMSDVDSTWPFKKMLDYVLSSGFSRLPVFEGNEDHIIGVIYVKDLLPYSQEDDTFDWLKLIRDAYFVPENKRIDDILREFRNNKVHISIVVDEFGGTSGLITMEDILEEIVGDITDEYDEEETPFLRLSDGSYLFEGKSSISDVLNWLDLPDDAFGEMGEEVDTISGLVLEILQELPRVGDTAKYDQFRFQVTQMEKRRITQVKLFPFERSQPIDE